MLSAIDRFRVSLNFQFDNYTMLYLSFTLAFAQMMIMLLLIFESPFRNPLIVWLDELNKGRAQLVVKSVFAMVFIVMMYDIYSVLEIRSRSVDAVNSSDHVVMVYRMLEAYLMGFSIILLVAINSLHQYIKECVMVTDTIRAAKKENRAYEDCIKKTADEAEILKKDIFRLKTVIRNLEFECSIKEQAVQLKRADSSALKSKLEGLFEEYDHLLAYNKDLKDQLKSVNERLSRSGGKKSVFFSWDRWGL